MACQCDAFFNLNWLRTQKSRSNIYDQSYGLEITKLIRATSTLSLSNTFYFNETFVSTLEVHAWIFN